MTRRLLGAVTRALRGEPTTNDVHFHQGTHGQPAVCFTRSCDRPQLDVH